MILNLEDEGFLWGNTEELCCHTTAAEITNSCYSPPVVPGRSGSGVISVSSGKVNKHLKEEVNELFFKKHHCTAGWLRRGKQPHCILSLGSSH